ncbi:MAG: ferritin-like domain-containing protein [Polyangiaceae bacterium]
MPVIEMRAARARIDLPDPDLRSYTREQIRFAVASWPLRAAEELRSALIYRALAQAAIRAHAPDPWPKRFFAVMRDEARHARVCATTGRQLGAEAPHYDATPVRARLAGLPEPLFRAATLLVVEVAMGETISMSLFRTGRDAAIEPLTRKVLSAIVTDEARHQRLGWTGSAALWPLLCERQRIALQREAAKGLAVFEEQNVVPALRLLKEGALFDPAHAALGVLAPSARVDAFYYAVEKLIVPRLDRLGLDGRRAWEHRYRSDSSRA